MVYCIDTMDIQKGHDSQENLWIRIIWFLNTDEESSVFSIYNLAYSGFNLTNTWILESSILSWLTT